MVIMIQIWFRLRKFRKDSEKALRLISNHDCCEGLPQLGTVINSVSGSNFANTCANFGKLFVHAEKCSSASC